MLHSAKKLQGFRVVATDGDIGEVEDIYFDDHRWTIRYLIVDTGGWLTGRKVLISPISVEALELTAQEVRVNLSRKQVEDSPGVDTEQPISRQQEIEFYRHYDYPFYWAGPLLWGFGAFPPLGGMFHRSEDSMASFPGDQAEDASSQHVDSYLRSAAEVIGYHIRATDDAIGHVEDFLFNDRDWSIRLILVATRNWWPGKHVLISPQRIESVSWPDRHVFVNVTRQAIENSPEYDPSRPLSDQESDLYRNHGKTDE